MCMTRGRYLAAKSEAEHYQRELKREQDEIINVPDTGTLHFDLISFFFFQSFDFDRTVGLR